MGDDRLLDLEVKLAFIERHLLDLDGVVRQLSDRVDALGRELVELRDQGPGEKPSLESEKPPHYG